MLQSTAPLAPCLNLMKNKVIPKCSTLCVLLFIQVCICPYVFTHMVFVYVVPNLQIN